MECKMSSHNLPCIDCGKCEKLTKLHFQIVENTKTDMPEFPKTKIYVPKEMQKFHKVIAPKRRRW